MTDGDESTRAEEQAREEPEVEALDESDESKVRDLLRGALAAEAEPLPESRVLEGVQRRIRQRSGGKFYADGWSTAKHPPIGTYFVTSFIMLLVLFAVYAALTSLSGEAEDVENTPAPVRIVFPRK